METYRANFRDSVIAIFKPSRGLCLVIVDVDPIVPKIGSAFVMKDGVDLVLCHVQTRGFILERFCQFRDPCYF
jgi:hypothetical protein